MNKLELLVKEHEENVGFGRVEDLRSSYYILSDGTFLGCNYDMGSRGDDHRAIFSSCEVDRDDWEALHNEYNLIRYIPEIETALIKVGQKITKKQMEIIEAYGLEIEEY